MIKEYKNKHKGERAFIIGNGPSLKKTPLNKIKKENTIAMNKIDMIFDKSEWRPKYYVFYDVSYDHEIPKRTKKSVNTCIKYSEQSFIPKAGKKIFGERESIEYFTAENISKCLGQEDLKEKKDAINSGNIEKIWSEDISNKICNFGSTVSVAAQIASFMGFEKIYFLGTDLYEETILDRFYFMKKLKLLLQGYLPLNTNHFTSQYSSGYPSNITKLNQNLRETHKVIKMASEKYGFDVFNATCGGNLDVYERVNIEKVI